MGQGWARCFPASDSILTELIGRGLDHGRGAKSRSIVAAVGSERLSKLFIDDCSRHPFLSVRILPSGDVWGEFPASSLSLSNTQYPLLMCFLKQGIFTTIVLAVLSWYTGYVLIQFKVNHPGVMNFSDAGRVVAGKYGAWMFGAMLIIKVILSVHLQCIFFLLTDCRFTT